MNRDDGNAKLNAAKLEAVLRGPEPPKVAQMPGRLGDEGAIKATLEKTARLRAMRLAKEEAERTAKPVAPPSTKGR